MTEKNPNYEWYESLKKPSWAPRREVFGMVWTVLYPLIIGSFGFLGYKVFAQYYPLATAVPFVANLAFNALFTPMQFRLRSNIAALACIIAIDITLISAMIVVYPYSKVIALVQIPYLVWVLYATALQISITKLNWNRNQTQRVSAR